MILRVDASTWYWITKIYQKYIMNLSWWQLGAFLRGCENQQCIMQRICFVRVLFSFSFSSSLFFSLFLFPFFFSLSSFLFFSLLPLLFSPLPSYSIISRITQTSASGGYAAVDGCLSTGQGLAACQSWRSKHKISNVRSTCTGDGSAGSCSLLHPHATSTRRITALVVHSRR